MIKKRILYYDMLNIAACFGVLCLHHNGMVHEYANDIVWKQCLVAEVLFYWAVPIFLMLSGANLMNYKEKYSTIIFFRKRLMKVVFPWIFWSLLILAWKLCTNRYELERVSIKEVVNIVLNSKMESVYWFFPMIIGLYLFMPVLTVLAENKYHRVLWYAVAYAVIVNGTVPLICSLLGIEWNGGLSSPLNGYVIFIIMGYLLAGQDIPLKKRNGLYVVGIACLVIRYLGIYILCIRDGSRNGLFFNYCHIYTYGLAAAIFVLFKYIPWEKFFDRINKKYNCKSEFIIAQISGCSLGIYLIHQIVMSYEMAFFHMDARRFLWRTAGPFVTYVVCLLIVLLIKKIPLGKYIVP